MSEPDPIDSAGLAALIAGLRPATGRAAVVVAIDGGAAAGKSTLAAAISAHLARVALIHTDDLLDGWAGQFHYWNRLRSDVLTPLLAGRPGHHQRYSWLRGSFVGQITVPAAPIVLVEGVSSIAACGTELTLGVLLDLPRAERERRWTARDGDPQPEWGDWLDNEDRHFADHQPDDRTIVLRPPGPVFIERDVIRLVVQDGGGNVLLLHTREPTMPELGEWWELPGGGIEPGEDCAAAAVRELREETGLVVDPDRVGAPSWRRTSTFRHRNTRRVQHETVARIRLAAVTPALDGSLRLDYEHEDYLGHRWWPVAAIAASSERFYPGRLPRLLGDFLSGVAIDEPFELWS
jgi:8-oxo-dGTP pyrophosphatase MutT (NUDIX family)